ncbi:MAG: allene oxide cyclase family protein [Planctomycetaceae bacterium]
MRKAAFAAGLVTVLVLGAVLAGAAFGGSQVTAPTTIHVIEHALSDKVTDTGKDGDSPGDLLTWHNPLFNSTNSKRVGHDQGDCIRISPKNGSWECRWISFVPGGSITVEGPFYDTRDNVLAITGGTGMYRNARGTMALMSRKGGTEYDFIFHVIP